MCVIRKFKWPLCTKKTTYLKKNHIKVELRDFSSIRLAEVQVWIYTVLMGLWRSRRSQALLMETQNGMVPMEGNLGTLRKITYVFVYLLAQHLESY